MLSEPSTLHIISKYLGSIVTWQVEACLPSAVVAVIVVMPVESAVITPFLSTEAILLLPDDHVTLLSDALSGVTVAVS